MRTYSYIYIYIYIYIYTFFVLIIKADHGYMLGKNRIKAAATIFLVFFQKSSKSFKATHSVEITG